MHACRGASRAIRRPGVRETTSDRTHHSCRRLRDGDFTGAFDLRARVGRRRHWSCKCRGALVRVEVLVGHALEGLRRETPRVRVLGR